jgi:diaminopimelate epimerase
MSDTDPLRFTKGHGTENDFVLLADPERSLDLTPSLVQALCDRRAGIGADGVLRAVLASADPCGTPYADAATWYMDYRNADGSPAEMCGNGIRVFALFLIEHGLVDRGLAAPGTLVVATRDGLKELSFGADGEVTVDMGTASLLPVDASVAAGGREWPATPVSTGNPHAVVAVDDPADVGPLDAAPAVTPADAFPDGVNVELVALRRPGEIALRVHERGSGETRSCGTGACAAAFAAAVWTQAALPASYAVAVPGGRLRVDVGQNGQVRLTGPAVLVADGELRPEWLAAARTR